MRITAVEVARERLPLTRCYLSSRETIDAIDIFSVVLRTASGATGIGSASPVWHASGETADACEAALGTAAMLLTDRDGRELGNLTRLLEHELVNTPAARAACDMAVWDLLGHHLGVPVVELLGRAHSGLPTSATIGVLPPDEVVAQAESLVGAGFRAVKVKIGRDVEEEIALLRRLRERLGGRVAIRTDANGSYGLATLERFLDGTRGLGLELCEQPLPRGMEDDLRIFSPEQRRRFTADESVRDARDAADWLQEPRPFGVYNIKLMECGGISGARRISAVAEAGGIELMWGCVHESRVGIAAALHTALATPATRYLDLDGSFNLEHDFVTGGFLLADGVLRPAPGAGLGVALAR